MLVYKERGKPENLGGKGGTNTKLIPHMALMQGFEPVPHRWQASVLTTHQ